MKKFASNEFCDDCQKEEKGVTSDIPTTPKQQTMESILCDVNKKLEILYKMEKQQQELVASVEFYAEKYQELFEFKMEAEKRFKLLDQRNVYLDKCNKALEERVQDLEQREKEKNIEIVGLEKHENENFNELVQTICGKIGVNPQLIQEVKRVGAAKSENPRPRPVIVTMQNKKARDEWLAKRKMKITNDDIQKDGVQERIYINEDLIFSKRQLLWETKQKLRPAYKYIWVQNSKILIKRDDTVKKIHCIRNEGDILDILSLSKPEK